ncbi:MAG: hypothetical protein LAO21_11710 [Acidobacteriia bacterium]|nr:hypothetical protein [Terriglobia bacterium]
MKRILESKRALRRKLASLPEVEKLRMLDDLRQRALTLRRAAIPLTTGSRVLRESPREYRAPEEGKK